MLNSCGRKSFNNTENPSAKYGGWGWGASPSGPPTTALSWTRCRMGTHSPLAEFSPPNSISRIRLWIVYLSMYILSYI